MAEDEELDTETLQAQINLSMAYVHDMVSAWVKPSTSSAKTSSRTIDKEIQDTLRRPPRLGVGAPIPEITASSSREAARLKSHLTKVNGKKRARDDLEEEAVVGKHVSGDEDESRAGAIRQKKGKFDSNSVPNNKLLHPPTLISAASSGRNSKTDEFSQMQSSEMDALKPTTRHVDVNEKHRLSTKSTPSNTRELEDNAHESSSTLRLLSPKTTPKKKKKKKKKATGDGDDPRARTSTIPLLSMPTKPHSPSHSTFGKAVMIDRKSPSDPDSSSDEDDSTTLSPIRTPARSPIRSPVRSPIADTQIIHTSSGPLRTEKPDDSPNEPRRKRRKRRKKRHPGVPPEPTVG